MSVYALFVELCPSTSLGFIFHCQLHHWSTWKTQTGYQPRTQTEANLSGRGFSCYLRN